MKVISLTGKHYVLSTKASEWPMKPEGVCRSKIQFSCGQLLRKIFKSEAILEDIYIPDGFYLDYFLPAKRLAIEIQGRQHEEYVPYFHGSKKKFLASQTRDYNKQQWCELNSIQLLTVRNEKELLESLS